MDANNPHFEAKNERRFSLRFSLWTLFVLALLLSLVFSNLFTSWNLQKARQQIAERESLLNAKDAEIKSYRQRLGILTIDDPQKVYIIALDTQHDLVWQWRVYVPPGKPLAVKSVIGKIPLQEFPPDYIYSTMDGGEWLITLAIAKDADGHWTERITRAGDSVTTESSNTVSDAAMKWYATRARLRRRMLAPSDGQQIFAPDQPIELVRIRHTDTNDSSRGSKRETLANGMVFWLEPKQEEEFEFP